MTDSLTSWLSLGGSIILGSGAQISLKHGLNEQKRISSNPVFLLLSPWVLMWLVSFGVATFLWITALRDLDLSYAYPLLALGYVLVTALAAILLHERVSKTQWIAITIITTGAAIVARSF